jgi:hypothetical protein
MLVHLSELCTYCTLSSWRIVTLLTRVAELILTVILWRCSIVLRTVYIIELRWVLYLGGSDMLVPSVIILSLHISISSYVYYTYTCIGKWILYYEFSTFIDCDRIVGSTSSDAGYWYSAANNCNSNDEPRYVYVLGFYVYSFSCALSILSISVFCECDFFTH